VSSTSEVALVFMAGGAGSVSRYLVGRLSAPWMGGAFPWGTLTVNLAGALLIGAVAGFAASRGLGRAWTLALGTGFLGGFTTFSAFALESVHLAQTRPPAAVGYIAATLVLGVAAAALGGTLARLIG
jgi:fluoride exporter